MRTFQDLDDDFVRSITNSMQFFYKRTYIYLVLKMAALCLALCLTVKHLEAAWLVTLKGDSHVACEVAIRTPAITVNQVDERSVLRHFKRQKAVHFIAWVRYDVMRKSGYV
jgi:hypothetical protein